MEMEQKNGTVCASLLPPITAAIYTQVMLHRMDSPPKHDSLNCA